MTDGGRNRVLGQRCRLNAFTKGRVVEQNDERRDRAHDDRVKVHAEGLNKSLLDRVANRRRRSSVRDRPLTGLIRKQATTYAVHERLPEGCPCDLANTQGQRHDLRKHVRNLLDIHRNDDETGDDVQHGHDGNQPVGDRRDTLHATEHDECRQDGQRDAQQRLPPHRVGARRLGNGVDNGVGLNRVIDKSVSHGNGDHEHSGQPLKIQPLGDVVGRAASIGIGVLHLVQLRQCGLDKCGGATDYRDQPHPEHSAGPTDGDGHCDTGDIACPHPRCRRNSKRLERGDSFFIFRNVTGFFCQRPKHFRNHTDLNNDRTETEPHTCR